MLMMVSLATTNSCEACRKQARAVGEELWIKQAASSGSSRSWQTCENASQLHIAKIVSLPGALHLAQTT